MFWNIVDWQGEEGEQDVCPRCQGKVFEAEKIVAKSGSYHKEGFTEEKIKKWKIFQMFGIIGYFSTLTRPSEMFHLCWVQTPAGRH